MLDVSAVAGHGAVLAALLLFFLYSFLSNVADSSHEIQSYFFWGGVCVCVCGWVGGWGGGE